MVSYTSGSTGQPKGAIISEIALNFRLAHPKLGDASGTIDVVMAIEPLSAAFAPTNILRTLLAGGRAVTVPESGVAYDAIRMVSPTVLGGVPQALPLLCC